MNVSDIVKVCLDIEFGSEPKKSLKEFINKALDLGEYQEGFEIAINKNDLDYQEYEELYKSFESAYREKIPSLADIRKIVDKYLPQSYFSNVDWLVSDLGNIYATDGLRVAKIVKNNLVWVTERISYDGINLIRLTDSELVGQWYYPMDDENPWRELKLSIIDGALLVGEVIEFGNKNA